MLTPMSNTTHISWKPREKHLRQREKWVSQVIHKNISDTYKYAMNKLYLEIKEDIENGKQVNIY